MSDANTKRSFAQLLTKHLKRGTRPDFSPDQPGQIWKRPDFARKIGVDSHTVGNWCNGHTLPSAEDFSSIETYLFGSLSKDGKPDKYASERVELRRAFNADVTARRNRQSNTNRSFSKGKPDQGDDLRYLGENLAGVQWFLDNFNGITNVYNTVFTRTEDTYGHLKPVVPQFQEAQKELLSTGECTWKDIVLKEEREDVEKFYKQLSLQQREHYQVREISTALPLFQCLIVHHKERRSVLFGWSFRKALRGRVYLSRGESTVLYFEDYCIRLFQCGTPIFDYD